MTDTKLSEGQFIEYSDGRRFVIESVDDGDVFVGELGDRWINECPVEFGDECIDPDCDGRVGEYDSDDELSAHELYCYECGLNWVERSGHWEETYVGWCTSWTFEGQHE